MAAAAQIVEGMGADIVDVNMGCPVPKIAKHNAGCSLMREPEHAARVIGAMTKAVKIPVTVKMRAGWNDQARNAPELARMVQDAGAAAVTIHGRTAEQSYSGCADWDLVSQVAERADDSRCSAAATASSPSRSSSGWQSGVSGVLVGRGVLRNPWILAQAADLAAGRRASRRHAARARPVPARLHRAAAQRAGQRGRRLPPRRARRMDGRQPARRRAAASAGSSTSCARCVPGIRRGSRAGLSCACA